MFTLTGGYWDTLEFSIKVSTGVILHYTIVLNNIAASIHVIPDQQLIIHAETGKILGHYDEIMMHHTIIFP